MPQTSVSQRHRTGLQDDAVQQPNEQHTQHKQPASRARHDAKKSIHASEWITLTIGVSVLIAAVWWSKPWTLFSDQFGLHDVFRVLTTRPSKPSAADVASLPQCGDEITNYVRLARQIKAQGGQVDAVELGYFNGIRGLRAKHHIPAGSHVLRVPFEAALSIATTSGREAAAAVTTSWQQIEDADMQLDTLALLYESFVLRHSSPWFPYFCTLPQQFDLPIQYTDSWSLDVVAALPELQRLVQKRKSQVKQYQQMAYKALQSMPGGSWRMHVNTQAKSKDENFGDAFLRAYMVTKTRTVTLDLSEHQVPLPDGLDWLTEIGALVPILDLANHAPLSTANTYFAVDKQGSNVSLSLIAARDVNAGEEVMFSYVPNDDEEPECNLRWLLEYGFIIQDGKPQRDCFSINMTTKDLTRASSSSHVLQPHMLRIVTEGLSPSVAQLAEGSFIPGDAQVEHAVGSLAAKLGLPSSVHVELVKGASLVIEPRFLSVQQWISTVMGEDADHDITYTVVCAVFQHKLDELWQQLTKSQAAAQDTVYGSSSYRQEALLELLSCAMRAVSYAMGAIGCVSSEA